MNASSAAIETLESRVMLTMNAGYKIPVLVYHDIVTTAGVNQDSVDVTVANFKSQMQWLYNEDYQSISLTHLRNWLADPDGYDMPIESHLKPFVMIFDDGNRTDLRARQVLQENNIPFTGVIATTTFGRIATNSDALPATSTSSGWSALEYDGGETPPPQSQLSWNEMISLSNSGWDIASHAVKHVRLGAGGAEATTRYQNTPTQINTQVRDSQNHIDNNGLPRPIAFVHPHHDATYRSIAIADTYYDLVFGAASRIGDGINNDEPVHAASNLRAGTLYRQEVRGSTTQTQFEDEVEDMTNTAISLMNHNYPEIYKARTGLIVIDGSDFAETISVGGTTLATTVSYTRSGGTLSLNGNASTPAYSDGPIETTGVDIRVAGGNDTFTLNLSVVSYLDGGLGDDALTGNSLADSIFGTDGNDVLSGLGGPDSIDGGAGIDQLFGGDQSDTILGGTQNDSIRGGSGNDSISGQGGNDSIWGEGGSDILGGDAGDDWISGGLQNDNLTGGSGFDTYVTNDDGGVIDIVAYDPTQDTWTQKDPGEA
jgi:Ca2+-binding RTX toxin-like protein